VHIGVTCGEYLSWRNFTTPKKVTPIRVFKYNRNITHIPQYPIQLSGFIYNSVSTNMEMCSK